jgi:peptide/nickel transport system ATP-binding protein
MTESPPEPTNVLEVKNLTTVFPTAGGDVPAVRDVSLVVPRGEVLAVVGESGSGKSTLGLSVIGLVPHPGKIRDGDIILNGRQIRSLPPNQLRQLRGSEVAMIFQDPLTALNPAFTVGSLIAEVVRTHQRVSRQVAHRRAVEALRAVQIPDALRRSRQYPHELSGGMRQRSMIAMALALRPKLLIADEPTTALDVTIEAQILDLLDELRHEFQMSIMFITHDLGVVARISDSVAVMYAGRIVEHARAESLFRDPSHPYTVSLLESVPHLDIEGDAQSLRAIPGQPPIANNVPPGCAFHPRCFLQDGRTVCREDSPALRTIGFEHTSACHFAEELKERDSGREVSIK